MGSESGNNNSIKFETNIGNVYTLYPNGNLCLLLFANYRTNEILTCRVCCCKYKTKNHYYHLRKHKECKDFTGQKDLMSDYILK